MHIFSNNISVSGDPGKQKKSPDWFSLLKISEKEPKITLQKSLEDVQSGEDLVETTESQMSGKGDLKHQNKDNQPILESQSRDSHEDNRNGKTGIVETQLNDQDLRDTFDGRNDLPLYADEVWPKHKHRAEQNEDYYKKYKEKVGPGDVVSASVKKAYYDVPSDEEVDNPYTFYEDQVMEGLLNLARLAPKAKAHMIFTNIIKKAESYLQDVTGEKKKEDSEKQYPVDSFRDDDGWESVSSMTTDMFVDNKDPRDPSDNEYVYQYKDLEKKMSKDK